MTPRQRLLAAMRRQPTDRLPVQVRGVRILDDEWVSSQHPSYAPVIEAVQEWGDPVQTWSASAGLLITADAAARTETRVLPSSADWDLHVTTLRTPRGELTAERLVSRTGQPGMTVRHYVQSPDQLDWLLDVPYVPPRPALDGYVALRDRIGERGLLIAQLPNPVAHLHNLLGTEHFALAMMDAPDRVLALLWELQRRLENLVSYLLDAGVGPAFGDSGPELAAPPIMSARFFRRLYTEPATRTAALLHAGGALLHVHCHGSVRQLLPDFIEIGVDALHPLEAPPLGDTPLEVGKQVLGGKVCIEGNVQIGDIYSMGPAQFEGVVRRAIEVGAPGGGFILCPTASPFTPELPPNAVANWLTLVRLGSQYRYAA
jgi:uroporphyrinogen-III decarboxylase